ncbi:MAG: 50S ribosomal protein L24 [Candidatus Wallbacteria bacterium]
MQSVRTVTTEIKKGDFVRVINGKYEGKQGKVLSVNRVKGTILIEGVNLIKRHQRPNQKVQKGGIIEKEAPIYACKTMLVCPKCSKVTRIAHLVKGSKKVRACKKCNEMIDQM